MEKEERVESFRKKVSWMTRIMFLACFTCIILPILLLPCMFSDSGNAILSVGKGITFLLMNILPVFILIVFLIRVYALLKKMELSVGDVVTKQDFLKILLVCIVILAYYGLIGLGYLNDYCIENYSANICTDFF